MRRSRGENGLRRIGPIADYVWREVRGQEELEQSLALRYRTYEATNGLARLASLDPVTRLDLDAYDLHACHLALFRREGGAETLVGTMRIAGATLAPLAEDVRQVAHRHPSLASHLAIGRTAPLPMLSYLVQSPRLLAVYAPLAAGGERIAEPGRLCLDAAARTAAARAGVRLSHFMIECALAFGWSVLGLDRVFVDCDVRLGELYEHFGFANVPGVPAEPQPTFGVDMAVYEATPAMLPASLAGRVSRIASQLLATGEASYRAASQPSAHASALCAA